jgi:hypothetical protein
VKTKETLHRKVQDLVDCFATTDPLKEMWMLKEEKDQEEASLKWLALAVIYGINAGAKDISVVKSADGTVKILAQYRKAELPTPGPKIGGRIFDSLRRITHLEGDKGKTVLAMGVRDGSIELRVKIEKEKEEEKITLAFPQAYDGGEPAEEKQKKKGKSEPKPLGGDMEYCRFAAAAEHGRASIEEEPCDDARAGDFEKQIGKGKREK